jgi:hypothetical protein
MKTSQPEGKRYTALNCQAEDSEEHRINFKRQVYELHSGCTVEHFYCSGSDLCFYL